MSWFPGEILEIVRVSYHKCLCEWRHCVVLCVRCDKTAPMVSRLDGLTVVVRWESCLITVWTAGLLYWCRSAFTRCLAAASIQCHRSGLSTSSWVSCSHSSALTGRSTILAYCSCPGATTSVNWYVRSMSTVVLWYWALSDTAELMSTIASHSPLNISETVRDRGLVPKDHH